MMINEIYDWFDSRSGNCFDFHEEVEELTIQDAFLSPVDWYNTISITIERLEDCIDVINDYKDEIPDEFPNHQEIKKMIIEDTTLLLLEKINEVKRRIGIKTVNINNVEQLIQHLSMLSKLISICKETTVNSIVNKLSKFEEETNYFLSDNFDITEKDFTQVYSDITDLVEEFEEDVEDGD